MMKTKVCSSCGQELELSNFFHWVKKDGSIGYLHQCFKCQRAKAYRRHVDKKKQGEMSKFADKVLIDEVKKRGYSVFIPMQKELGNNNLIL